MAKLSKLKRKVFALNATKGVFGSKQAGNPQKTATDYEALQSLPAYENGFGASTLGAEKLVPQEDMDSAQSVDSYKTNYLLQEGIPEWDANDTYYKGGIVKIALSNGSYSVCMSLTDNNTGNNPSADTTNWGLIFNTSTGVQSVANMEQSVSTSTTKYPSSKAVSDLTSARGNPTGTIITWSTSTAPAGYLICDGSAISRTTYAALFAVIGTIYGGGDGNTTFNVPNATERAFWQSSTAPVGNKGLGRLPNITGSVGLVLHSSASQVSGAFYANDIATLPGGGSFPAGYTQFDASLSSSIYGSIDKVIPAYLCAKFCIKY